MSVIGRLDKQVDERLIAPVARRRGGQTERAAPTAVPKDEISKRPRRKQPLAEGAEQSGDQERAHRDELPVWLL